MAETFAQSRRTVFLLGARQIDLDRMVVLDGDKEFDLSRRETSLLARLWEANETTVSAADLYRAAWNLRATPDGRPLTFAMRRLRQKLEPNIKTPQYLLTVRGVGFRLVGGVESADQSSDTPLAAPVFVRQGPDDQFVGRVSDIAAVRAYMEEKGRLFTFTGEGGCGKSRLAMECLSQDVFCSRPMTVSVVELKECDSSSFLYTLTQELGFGLESSEDWATGVDSIGRTLGEGRDRLLVLDNVDRCVAAVIQFVETVLSKTSNVCFWVTSREVLRSNYETVHRIQSLSIGDAETLFWARAYPNEAPPVLNAKQTAALDEIIRHLAPNPLSLELAAGRVHGLSLQGIQNRLSKQLSVLSRSRRDVSPRHLTLRATIRWSWELLTEPEQRLLVQCSVFQNGFHVSLLSMVLGQERTFEILALIENLVDKSLLVSEKSMEEPRFTVSSSLRQFVFEEVASSEVLRETLRLAQIGHMEGLLRSDHVRDALAKNMLCSMDQVAWLQVNLTNLMSAQAFALKVGLFEEAVCLLRVAVMLMLRSSAYPSIVSALETMLSALTKEDDSWVWVQILMAKVFLRLGKIEQARGRAIAACEVAEKSASKPPLGFARLMMVEISVKSGEFDSAIQLNEIMEVEGFEHAGLRAAFSFRKAVLFFSLRDWAQCRLFLDGALEAYRSLEAPIVEARLMYMYTQLAGVQGHIPKALLRARETLRLAQTYDDRTTHRNILETSALISLKQGDLEESENYFERALELRRTVGFYGHAAGLHNNRANLLHLQGREEEAIREFRKAIRLAQEVQQPLLEVLAMGNLACVLMEKGELDEAETLIHKSLDQAQKFSHALWLKLGGMTLGVCRRLKGHLDEGEALWASGATRWESVATPDQYARILLLRASAEIDLDRFDLVEQLCAEADGLLAAIPDRDIFECLWFRKQVANKLQSHR